LPAGLAGTNHSKTGPAAKIQLLRRPGARDIEFRRPPRQLGAQFGQRGIVGRLDVGHKHQGYYTQGGESREQ
jgi:hypothetical protein